MELKKNESPNQNTTQPTTVAYTSSDQGGVQSIQADVRISSYKPRILGSQRTNLRYRFYKKIVQGKVYLRFDYPADSSLAGGGVARTVISTDKEKVIFQTETQRVEYRFPAREDNSPAIPMGADLTRKIPDIKSSLARLRSKNFKLSEDISTNTVTALQTTFPQSSDSFEGERLLSRKIMFDLSNSVVSGMEFVSMSPDGIKRTESITNAYAQTPDGPVEVGRTTTTKIEYPDRNDTSDRTIATITDPSEIPIITPEELLALSKKDGIQILSPEPLIGDPGDKTQIEVITETWENVQINTVSDNLFLIPN